MDEKSKSILSNKILSVDEVKKIIGPFPRNKKTILCHGTFDIVHPGHIRHLLYAKTHCDILIVSITCDNFNSKTKYRPFVPDSLRALNLAALEMVNYVIIDQNEKPLSLLKFLKPDFFAKGFEYNKEKINPKTSEELDILKSYGGDIIFTPGDVVYSSSSIIENSAPNLSIEKLELLMKAGNVTFADLKKTLNSFTDIKVHIIGDTIVDTHTNCSMIGGMTKTPTMSIKYENQKNFIGGAAVVAKHIKSAGASVEFTTILGNDNYAKLVVEDLKKNKIKINEIIDSDRPTTNKNSIICNNYRLLKIDTLENKIISEQILNKILKTIKSSKADIVILSDFRHGIFNRTTIPRICKSIPKKTFKVADSQVASRWGNITEFRNFDLITPNEREARFALGDQDSHIRPLASQLYENTKCKFLILKLGEKGVLGLRNRDKNDPRRLITLDSFCDSPIDPVGAGDALLAYSSLSLKISNSEIISIVLGNLAAGLECEKNGNIAVSKSKVLSKINELEKKIEF